MRKRSPILKPESKNNSNRQLNRRGRRAPIDPSTFVGNDDGSDGELSAGNDESVVSLESAAVPPGRRRSRPRQSLPQVESLPTDRQSRGLFLKLALPSRQDLQPPSEGFFSAVRSAHPDGANGVDGLPQSLPTASVVYPEPAGPGAIHQLMVHQTLLANERGYVFVSNINVPERLLQNPISRLALARRIRAFGCTDYAEIPMVQFQITASFELRHVTTGAIRQWTGSFNPSGNRTTSLHNFELFEPAGVFERAFVRSSDPAVAADILRTRPTGVDSSWIFHRLTSVIVCLQAVVGRNHHAIYSRQLLNIRSGRRRAIRSFPLP